MTKSLMISIQPQHALNILNGKKTLELRTWIPKDYVGWVYVYVTKGVKNVLHKYKDKYYTNHYLTFTDSLEALNSKVAFRFWFDDYETYNHDNHGVCLYTDIAEYNVMYGDLEKLCLDYREIEHYGKGKDLYAWHIKQLEIFDTPKELSEFYKIDVKKELPNEYYLRDVFSIKKAPQRSVWVYAKEIETNYIGKREEIAFIDGDSIINITNDIMNRIKVKNKENEK